jgi:hypothetical protein
MHKLKLRLESLRVETFATTLAPPERGTVFGEQCTCYTQCTCPGCATCDASCNGSCNSCGCAPSDVGGSACGTCDAGCTIYATVIAN